MSDQCRIWRDRRGDADEIIDPVTLKLVRPPDNDDVVYDTSSTGHGGRPLEGKCRIRIRAETDPHVVTLGGQQTGPRLYELFVPWDAPVASRGNLVVITYSLRDDTLVDQSYRIADVIRTSLLVHRKYILRDFVTLDAGASQP